MRYLLLALLLSACGSTGAVYAPENIPHAKASQLVIYRPASFVMMARSPSVDVNGIETCTLPNGSYMTLDVAPGVVNISASHWDMPGTSRLTLSATGRHYVRMSYDRGKVMSTALGGAVALTAHELSAGGGPLHITEVAPGVAEEELLETKQATSCK